MLAVAGHPCRSRDNGAMRRVVKWVLAGVSVPVLLLGAVALALQQWVGSADFRGRVAQQASSALRVPVEFGRITVDVWPLPAVALDRVQVKSKPALTLEHIEVRPTWAALLQGRLEIATLVVRQAVLPEEAVAALVAGLDHQPGAPGTAARRSAGMAAGMMPRRILLDQVSWVPAKGNGSTIDAQLLFDPDGLPDSAKVQVKQGRFQGARALLERGAGDWALHAELGGGTVRGKLKFQNTGKVSVLQAELDTANVEVAALTAPSRTLTGRLEAHTTLRAELGGRGSMADSVQSQTRFTVRQAVVHGIDLAQAVKTVGMNRGGETRLDTLAGQIVTRGRAVQLNNLVATSGLLSAGGEVAMAPSRALSGRVSVQLAGAAGIAVPLEVGGTMDSPSVTLSRGAVLGAAIGTVLAPGVGTGAGAALGDKLRGLFGR